jgi:hypothetical protein
MFKKFMRNHKPRVEEFMRGRVYEYPDSEPGCLKRSPCERSELGIGNLGRARTGCSQTVVHSELAPFMGEPVRGRSRQPSKNY